MTTEELNKKKLTQDDFAEAAQHLGCEIAVIKTVDAVECSGFGFYQDGELLCRFEGHHFRRLTKARFAKTHPHLNATSSEKNNDFAKKGRAEFSRFLQACKLAPTAALLSTSWGRFQIMGFNYKACGFETVQEMVLNFYKSEGNQLKGFMNYCIHYNLIDDLQQKNWATFAFGYNGPGYARLGYDKKLATKYKQFK